MVAALKSEVQFESNRHHEEPRVKAAHVVVAGLGASGLAAARHLSKLGEEVLVIDSRTAPPGLADLRLAAPEIRIELESLDPMWLEGAKKLVVSPGLPDDLPLVLEARRRGLDVVGEMELFAATAQAPSIAVTGSNGKSTVVTLTSRMAVAQGMRALAGGNLGPPALDLLAEPVPDVYVLEVSSFQLETTESLRPVAATVLNVSPDHIDRHGSLERYAALKSKLLSIADTAVYNYDDPLVRAMGSQHARATAFSVSEVLESGWSVIGRQGSAGTQRWLARDGVPLIASRELAVGGPIGEGNALASLALIEQFGGALDPALDVLRKFEGLPHRQTRVDVRQGVTYIDDSKATNVGATVAALASMTGPVVLIAGGVGKGADFGPLAEAAKGRVRSAFLLGECAEAIQVVLAPVCETVRVSSMSEAVIAAAERALSGDVVLLSPGCASQDMFRDYRARGEAFSAAVMELPE
jgi:UDP-N-acetylmuramoylalanine--D-glutamate ligase